MEKFEKKAKWDGEAEVLAINRIDAAKGRVKENDIVIELPRGEEIFNDDIFGPSSTGKYYRIKIRPEDVLKISLLDSSKDVGSALRLGYMMGGRHMEVLIDGDDAFIPLDLPRTKLESFIQSTGLDIETQIVQKSITSCSGYFRGEEHAH